MMDQDWARERLEQEERALPYCDCGARTIPEERGGALWLECSSLGRPKALLVKLLTIDFPIRHTRRWIMADAELSAADDSTTRNGSRSRS